MTSRIEEAIFLFSSRLSFSLLEVETLDQHVVCPGHHPSCADLLPPPGECIICLTYYLRFRSSPLLAPRTNPHTHTAGVLELHKLFLPSRETRISPTTKPSNKPKPARRKPRNTSSNHNIKTHTHTRAQTETMPMMLPFGR